MSYLILTLIGFISTLFSIIVFRPIAIKVGLIDYPDYRKQHKGQIPLTGGLSIFTGLIVYTICIGKESSLVEIILISSLFILVLGVYDDLINLRPGIKLFIQLSLVTSTVYLSEIKIESLGFIFGVPYPLTLGLLSIPFSIISIVGVMNAFNMIDGLDGQAGSLSIIAIIGIFVFGLDNVEPQLYDILLTIFSGLIAFLIFNLTPNKKVKIFLGDGGSLLLGFVISFSLVYCTQVLKLFSPSFALWCVTIPLFDFFSVVILRKIEKKQLLKANRDHIHHFLEIFIISKKYITLFTASLGLVLLCLGYYLEINFPTLSFWIFIILFKFYLFIRLRYRAKIKK